MSTQIYEQFANKGTILDKKDDDHRFPPRPKSDATKRVEKLDLAVNRKSNVCSTCHMTKSLNGVHDCY